MKLFLYTTATVTAAVFRTNRGKKGDETRPKGTAKLNAGAYTEIYLFIERQEERHMYIQTCLLLEKDLSVFDSFSIHNFLPSSSFFYNWKIKMGKNKNNCYGPSEPFSTAVF